MVQVKLKDGKIMKVEKGTKFGDIAQMINSSLRKKVLVVEVDGLLKDLNVPVMEDCQIDFVTRDDERAFPVLNHSGAHLLAQAVKRLYPQALFWVGPAIEEGFYYDMDLGDVTLKDEDLIAIEQEMKAIVKQGEVIEHRVVSKKEALKLFADNPYKIDLINELDEHEEISVYSQGDFLDLCRGPHVENVKEIKAFKLLKVSGAYYKGDSKNKMFQRIYGIAFASEAALKEHLLMLEEAKKRDHKKLGRELDLFMLSEYGPGFPFWLPNGLAIRRELENFWYHEHILEGYEFIQTPILLNQELWEISGHWHNYRENMYTSTIDDRLFAIKPMNCPGGMLVYKRDLHSYRDLPLRCGELGLVHRHEASGALNGLFRVRNFTQDDAHIFMTEEQIESEIASLIAFMGRLYATFGLEYTIELSTRPLEKYIGSIEVWDLAEAALKKAMDSLKIPYKINPGDGAFYGPKLDFKIRDSLKRIWQCGTIQLDMNLPERFDLNYIDENGEKKRPVMLHRAIFGSFERFIGILIEHYAGKFPLWLAPIQVSVLPVMDLQKDYALEIKNKLLREGIRVCLDASAEKLGYRMRNAQIKKINYVLVVGDEEKSKGLVTYRKHGEQKQNTVSYEAFIQLIKEQIKNKE
ncbi:MAG: threonine--tRNA ligase [Bacilli bacterium]|jgi:threonyl-tRNA synthetase